MPVITAVKGRLVFNSRGNKTIEVDVSSDRKFVGRACAPSGASVGIHEVQSFPDNSPEKALSTLHENVGDFIGIDSSDQRAIYDVMKKIDSSPDYATLGGATAFALSIASTGVLFEGVGRTNV